MQPIHRHALFAIAIFAFAGGCKAGGCAANVLGDVVGQTGDAYCDRRYVLTPDKERASFCQEIIDTVAQSEFIDDCKDKHSARAEEGKCPRERIIGGCKLSKENDDGSDVYDWYYDISDIEEAAADAGADADAAPPDGEDGSTDITPSSQLPSTPIFKDPAKTKEDVKALCADKTRYEEGSTYVDP